MNLRSKKEKNKSAGGYMGKVISTYSWCFNNKN